MGSERWGCLLFSSLSFSLTRKAALSFQWREKKREDKNTISGNEQWIPEQRTSKTRDV